VGSRKDDADGVYRILTGEESDCLLVDTDGDSHFCQSWFEAFYRIDSLIYGVLFPQDQDHFIFHSAAVRHRSSGRIIWLMGPSMRGKSNLSVGMVQGGAFDYLSESYVPHRGTDRISGGVLPGYSDIHTTVVPVSRDVGGIGNKNREVDK
jgi:hypothetical protein